MTLKSFVEKRLARSGFFPATIAEAVATVETDPRLITLKNPMRASADESPDARISVYLMKLEYVCQEINERYYGVEE